MARHEHMSGMTRERAAAILSAYGATPSRWPEAERAALEAWAGANGEDFATLVREETALDAALDLDARASGDDVALAARILAARDGANVVRPQFGRAAWMRAAALAACAVLGLALGFANAPARDDFAGDLDAAFGAAFDLGDGAGG